jgi:hypothetical protein
MTEIDPTRHLLSRPTPLDLDTAAAEARVTLERGAEFDARPAMGSAHIVAISPSRALVIAGLLDELSLRLKPGLAVGPIRSDGSLSRLAQALSDDITRRIG